MKAKLVVFAALALSLLFVGAALAQKAPVYSAGVNSYLVGAGVELHKQTEIFIRGDYDVNGTLLTNDPLMELQYIFGVPGAIPPCCEDAADYDDDGTILTNDPLMALQYIFGVPGATPPPPPYPNCGVDPSADALNCLYHDFCMGTDCPWLPKR